MASQSDYMASERFCGAFFCASWAVCSEEGALFIYHSSFIIYHCEQSERGVGKILIYELEFMILKKDMLFGVCIFATNRTCSR